jgi:hypothetical protein
MMRLNTSHALFMCIKKKNIPFFQMSSFVVIYGFVHSYYILLVVQFIIVLQILCSKLVQCFPLKMFSQKGN